MDDARRRKSLALGHHSLLRQHFGYGVARVALAPDPAGGPCHVRPSVADALSALAGEVRAAGVVGSVRKTVTTVGTGLVAGVLVLLVFVMLSRDFQDPDLEIVRFESEPVPSPVPPPPLPVVPQPENPEPVPPPVVAPPVLAETPPPPPPVPEPVPAPVPEPPPLVVKPPPPMPAMPPAPPPPVTIARAAPVRPAPPPPAEKPRPQVRIDAVSKPVAAPAPAPAPARAERPEVARSKPRQPALAVDPVASQPFRVASSSRTSPAPRRAPAPGRKPSVVPNIAPALAPSAIATPDPAPARTTRTTRTAAAPRSASRPPPGALPAFAAAPAPEAARARAPAPTTRAAPPREVARADSRRSDPGDDIPGVALGTLAACVSDREEDRLKLAVMAAARNRPECKSRAGRYRFLETKNLNAFLMWIERAESSPPGDRCVELGLALECLQDRGRRGTDRT